MLLIVPCQVLGEFGDRGNYTQELLHAREEWIDQSSLTEN